MHFKSVLLASSLASLAFAQSSSSAASSVTASSSYSIASGCSFSTATATAQADLDKYSSCTALKGDLVIGGDLGSAALNDVKAVYGNILVTNATLLSSLSAGSLETVTGELSLTELTVLSNLNLPLLTTVGSINFVTLPALSSINLNTGVTEINSLVISDTALESLEGFDVSSLDVFNVNNNKYLNSITAALQSVKTSLEVSYNSADVEVAFDQLLWANNITFRDVSSISLASLEKVNASLGFINNSVSEIELSSLTSIGGSLAIASNSDLESVDFSNLTSIGGGFDISNNTDFSDIEGFESLETVGGAIIFVGNFTNATLPSLKRVSGGVTIESSGELDCDSFNKLNSKGNIQGNAYVCKGASTSVSAVGSSTAATSATSSDASSKATATGSSSASSSSKASKGGAAGSAIFQSGTFIAALGSFVLSLL